MKTLQLFALGILALVGFGERPAHAWGYVGVGFGGPCCYRPWGWGCYRPWGVAVGVNFPVYVAPSPVVVQPAPVVVQPATVVAPVSQAAPPAPAAVPQLQPVAAGRPADVDHYLQQLRDADERVRADAVMQLGRLKATQAVDPLAATLAGDRSPAVRDAAARALGLIGTTKGLPALKYAAQADADRDVRHSAQFAVEIIQSSLPR